MMLARGDRSGIGSARGVRRWPCRRPCAPLPDRCDEGCLPGGCHPCLLRRLHEALGRTSLPRWCTCSSALGAAARAGTCCRVLARALVWHRRADPARLLFHACAQDFVRPHRARERLAVQEGRVTDAHAEEGGQREQVVWQARGGPHQLPRLLWQVSRRRPATGDRTSDASARRTPTRHESTLCEQLL